MTLAVWNGRLILLLQEDLCQCESGDQYMDTSKFATARIFDLKHLAFGSLEPQVDLATLMQIR
jgi:hypothetical protein